MIYVGLSVSPRLRWYTFDSGIAFIHPRKRCPQQVACHGVGQEIHIGFLVVGYVNKARVLPNLPKRFGRLDEVGEHV